MSDQTPIRFHYIEIDGLRYVIQAFGSDKPGSGYFVHLIPVDSQLAGAKLRWDRWARQIPHVEVDSNALKHSDPEPQARYEAIDMSQLLTAMLDKFPGEAVSGSLLRDLIHRAT